MQSPRVTLRIPAALHAACERKARTAGVSIAEWLRGLAERETGVAADPQQGLAGVSEAKRRKIAMAGVRARKRKAKE